jgi:hypothetical protein
VNAFVVVATCHDTHLYKHSSSVGTREMLEISFEPRRGLHFIICVVVVVVVVII